MKKSGLKRLTVILIVLLLICMIPIAVNQLNGTYESLNSTDQTVLAELNSYIAAEKEAPAWEDYSLADKSILALNGTIGKAYLINPGTDIRSPFAKEIKMPQDYSIRVYRISAAAPQLLQFVAAGNFNAMGKTYSVLGSEVYFTKYTDASVETRQSSGHYITFLSHEAFHYYMQNSWTEGGGRFDTSTLTDRDLDLMEEQYAVFARIYDVLRSEKPDKSVLLSLAREYLDSEAARFRQNPDYMKYEALAEAAEGTATYVGLRASKAVNYDFEIMHFVDERISDEVIEWPFDTVVPLMKSGKLDKSLLASEWVYHTGALLCELIDELDIENWQQQLNMQTPDSPVTLYSILSEHINEITAE